MHVVAPQFAEQLQRAMSIGAFVGVVVYRDGGTCHTNQVPRYLRRYEALSAMAAAASSSTSLMPKNA